MIKKIKIIYIGNILSKYGVTSTTIEHLGPLLEDKYNVKLLSNKKNILHRYFDMVLGILFNLDAKYIIVDTYSTAAFFYSFTSFLFAKICKINFIPILHGGNLPDLVYKQKKIMSYFFKNSYKVVCPSKYLMQKIEINDKDNFINIPNPINLLIYNFKKRKISKDNINIFWLRSFHKIYNPQLAVEILNELNQSGYKAKLTMVGPEKDDSLKKTKFLIDKYNLYENVILTGLLSKEDWIAKSTFSNLFINTTTVDNTPVSVIEMMALGIPVISTNVGGMSFLIKNKVNGILTKDNNSKSFIECLDEIINDGELLDKIIDNAYKTSIQFSETKVKKLWEKVLI